MASNKRKTNKPEGQYEAADCSQNPKGAAALLAKMQAREAERIANGWTMVYDPKTRSRRLTKPADKK